MRDTASERAHLNASTSTDHARRGPTRPSVSDALWCVLAINMYGVVVSHYTSGRAAYRCHRPQSSASLRFTARHVRIERQVFPHPTILLPSSTRTALSSNSRFRDASGIPLHGRGLTAAPLRVVPRVLAVRRENTRGGPAHRDVGGGGGPVLNGRVSAVCEPGAGPHSRRGPPPPFPQIINRSRGCGSRTEPTASRVGWSDGLVA